MKKHLKEVLFLGREQGQAMILAVMALGGTILGVTTIAGLLMLFQIRQTTDLANSQKAVFSADAGIECGLFNFFKVPPEEPCPSTATLLNGANYIEVTNQTSTVLSRGFSGTAKRAFLLYLSTATATAP